MSSVTLQEFRENFPELNATVTDEKFSQAARVARSIVHGTKEQQLWAIAHLSVAQDCDLTGDTSSIQIGGLSRSFKVMSRTEADVFWSTTSYGRMYLTLLRQTPITGIGLLGVH